MILAPLPDALDMGGTTEVITIVGLVEPPPLTGRFARFAARWLRTVALASCAAAARVGIKEGPLNLYPFVVRGKGRVTSAHIP